MSDSGDDASPVPPSGRSGGDRTEGVWKSPPASGTRAGERQSAPEPSLAAAVAHLASALRYDQTEAAAQVKRQRRRAFWWRLVALLLIVGVVVSMALGDGPRETAHIARVDIQGMITDDRKRDALLSDLAESDQVKAVVLRIDSPGGTTVGGEALYESIRKISAEKPVVAVMGQVAASAAYIAALAADHIVARGNTLTGSVGVIFTAPNFNGALEQLGVDVVEMKSGTEKAEPSMFAPVDRERLDVAQEMIDESFEWFIGLVKERRQPTADVVTVISDGRTVTGRQALELDLIDVIGGEEAARAWLSEAKEISIDLEIRDRNVETRERGVLSQLVDQVFGVGSASRALSVVWRGPALTSELSLP